MAAIADVLHGSLTYAGGVTGTSAPADFINRLQVYFNPRLMEAIQYELVLAKFGWRKAYPMNGNTIRFFRPRKANTSGVVALNEAEVPTTYTSVAVGYKDIALAQRGALARISDLTQAVDLIDTVQLYVKTMGADAALDFDTVIRNALTTGLLNTDTTYGAAHPFERYAGLSSVTSDSSNDFDTYKVATTPTPDNGKFTRAAHLGAITQLKLSGVPKINGEYVAVVGPQVMHDLRQDTDWLAAATQVDTSNLYKRGTIRLDGAVFVETTNPMIESDTYGTYDASPSGAGVSSIFSTYYLGDGAFGCPELSDKRAGGSQFAPKIQILANADKSDPLNQVTMIGWKAMWGCAPLITNETGTVPNYLILRTKSTFQA